MGALKTSPEASRLEVRFELPLKALGRPLMERTRRGRHEEVSLQELIALPVRGNACVVVVVQLLLQPCDHLPFSAHRAILPTPTARNKGILGRAARISAPERLIEGISLTRLVIGQNKAKPTLPLYADGDNTRAGRRPACSCRACGMNESQAMSPRRGT